MELEDEESSSSHEVAVIEKDETAAEAVAPLEPVTVPIVALKAALMVTGEKRTEVNGKKSDVPANMQGVHIASREGEIRISATDGNRLFVYSVDISSALELPRWLASGITISLQLLKEHLTMLEKIGADDAVVSYQTNAPHLLLSDPYNRVTFRTSPVDEAFPVYDNVFSGIDLSARTTVDLESTAYQAGYLKGVADLAKVLDSNTVQVFASSGQGKPTLITFPGRPGAALVLMPIVSEDAAIPQSTMRVLSGPIAGTLAALRAHRTRWEKKLEKLPTSRAIQKKIAEYDQRIDAIVGRTAPALPAPEVDESDEEALMRLSQPDQPVRFVPTKDRKAVADAPDATTEVTATHRAKLKGAVATKALTKFYADVNAVLSHENDGLTLSQLADGVPIDSWWESGLSAEEVAKRCLDWRIKEPAAGK
jgi:hypothetical protein